MKHKKKSGESDLQEGHAQIYPSHPPAYHAEAAPRLLVQRISRGSFAYLEMNIFTPNAAQIAGGGRKCFSSFRVKAQSLETVAGESFNA